MVGMFGGMIFDVPAGAVVRHCDAQGDSVALWLEIPDTSAPAEQRWFRTFTTGQLIEGQGLTYLGTVLFDGGAFVLHVYEQPMAAGGAA